MSTATVSLQSATRFEQYLRENEKSPLTVKARARAKEQVMEAALAFAER